MSSVIFKYPILPGLYRGDSELDLPLGAQVLTFQEQNDTPTLWVRFDKAQQTTQKRKFRVVFTGEDFETASLSTRNYARELPHYGYIGTCTCNGLVLHCFEVLQ